MKVISSKYLKQFHNPFQYKQCNDLIFLDTKSKTYHLGLIVDSIDGVEDYFLEKYEVFVIDCIKEENWIIELESESKENLENILKGEQ